MLKLLKGIMPIFICVSSLMVPQLASAQQNPKPKAAPAPQAQPQPQARPPSQPQPQARPPSQPQARPAPNPVASPPSVRDTSGYNVRPSANPQPQPSQRRTDPAPIPQTRDQYNQQYNAQKQCYWTRTSNGRDTQVCNR